MRGLKFVLGQKNHNDLGILEKGETFSGGVCILKNTNI